MVKLRLVGGWRSAASGCYYNAMATTTWDLNVAINNCGLSPHYRNAVLIWQTRDHSKGNEQTPREAQAKAASLVAQQG